MRSKQAPPAFAGLKPKVPPAQILVKIFLHQPAWSELEPHHLFPDHRVPGQAMPELGASSQHRSVLSPTVIANTPLGLRQERCLFVHSVGSGL